MSLLINKFTAWDVWGCLFTYAGASFRFVSPHFGGLDEFKQLSARALSDVCGVQECLRGWREQKDESPLYKRLLEEG